MKVLVSTKNTLLSVNENGELFTNRGEELGLTIQQLKGMKEEGYNTGFPFSKIDLSEIEADFNFPKGELLRKGALMNRYFKNEIEQFREQYYINKYLSIGKFYDKDNYELKSQALIFTLHNGFDCGELKIETSFYEFNESFKMNQIKRKQAEAKAYDAFMQDSLFKLRGWYSVCIEADVIKFKGNDGKMTFSVNVLADSKFDAYEKAVLYLKENPPKNVYCFLVFDSLQRAFIEYIGVLNDEL